MQEKNNNNTTLLPTEHYDPTFALRMPGKKRKRKIMGTKYQKRDGSIELSSRLWYREPSIYL